MFARLDRVWIAPTLALAALQCGAPAEHTEHGVRTEGVRAVGVRTESARADGARARGGSNDGASEVAAGEAPADVAQGSAPEATAGTLEIEQSDQRIAGELVGAEASIQFSSTPTAELAGVVSIQTGVLRYDLHYDYGDARQVVADGHGSALDRPTQHELLRLLDAIGDRLGPPRPAQSLHEQMLAAALAMLVDSAGMPLGRLVFPLAPAERGGAASGGDAVVGDKSLGNDGVTCIERDSSYAVSYDFGETLVVDEPVTSNVSECNGQCGPTCTQLTPWRMWTLDCLEHDTCCDATSDDPCWTPLGECGDEYVDAEGDFLRGFDPFGKHCGG